jgi:hypothetical protein
VANSTPNDAAQHIASSLIPWTYAICEQEGHRTRVVSNHLIAESLLLKRRYVVTCDLLQERMDWEEEVGVIVREHLLADAGESLEAHPSIDTLEWQLGAPTIGVLFVLHKDKVPNLKPTRALFRVIGGTRRTTGELSAAIKVNLRTWAARSGLGHAPEVGIVTLLYVPPAGEAFRG